MAKFVVSRTSAPSNREELEISSIDDLLSWCEKQKSWFVHRQVEVIIKMPEQGVEELPELEIYDTYRE